MRSAAGLRSFSKCIKATSIQHLLPLRVQLLIEGFSSNERESEGRHKNRMEKKGRGAQITERKSGSRTTKNTTVSIKAAWL